METILGGVVASMNRWTSVLILYIYIYIWSKWFFLLLFCFFWFSRNIEAVSIRITRFLLVAWYEKGRRIGRLIYCINVEKVYIYIYIWSYRAMFERWGMKKNRYPGFNFSLNERRYKSKYISIDTFYLVYLSTLKVKNFYLLPLLDSNNLKFNDMRSFV